MVNPNSDIHRGSRGAAGRVVGRHVIERVIRREPLGLSGKEEGVIAVDKGEPVSSQNSEVAQGHRQLHGIVGSERMVLGQIRRGLEVSCGQRNNGIAICQLADESMIFSVALRALNPTYALDDAQGRSYLHARDFGDQDDIGVPFGFRISFLDQLAHPSASRFGNVVLNQGAGIEV